MNKDLATNLVYSYFIGLPIGLGFVALTLFFPTMFSNQGMLTLVMLVLFGNAIVGLVISFVISLWIGGNIAKNSILKGDKLILTSFKFSGTINLIIWTVFGIIASLKPENEFNSALIALIACVICTILTTVSIGLLISYKIRDRIKNTLVNI